MPTSLIPLQTRQAVDDHSLTLPFRSLSPAAATGAAMMIAILALAGLWIAPAVLVLAVALVIAIRSAWGSRRR